MTRRRTSTHPLALVVVAASLVNGCVAEQPAAGPRSRPLLVVSIFPLGDLAARLAADAVRVEVLLPSRASPATFELTPRAAASLGRAEAYLLVGAGLDEWAEALVPVSRGTVVHLADSVQPGTSHGTDRDGGPDPHIWLDPVLVRDRILPIITELLVRIAPQEGAAVRARSAALTDSLTALHELAETALSATATRSFVSTHAAWAHLAARYDLYEIGSVHDSPGHEPSARALARLVDTARVVGVQAVLAEPQLGQAAASALATELGVDVYVLDPLGGPSVDGRASYLDLMRFNVAQLQRALGASKATGR